MVRIKYKEAVGIQVKKGKPSIGIKPSVSDLERLYIKESRSIREVAEILRCSKDMVYRSLKEYGIELRSKTRRSQLRVYKLDHLRSEIDSKGYKQVAVDLGVGITTLRDYMKAKE